MHRRLTELRSEHFDVLVIGGGITGAWIALDCTSRGLSVAIIDKQDFGAGTSAKSSKLIHGGIRYLQQLRLDKVRESALERAYYHRSAPHLTHFVPFIVPTYRSWGKGRGLMAAGMTLYRLLCLGEDKVTGDPAKSVPAPYYLSRSEILEQLPLSDPGLSGAVIYYESHMESSERMTLAVLETAHDMGTACANYVRAHGLVMESGKTVIGVRAEDTESGDDFEIRARLTINATGPWISDLNRAFFDDKSIVTTTGYCRGSHIVTRQLVKDYAIALPTQFAGQNIVDRGGRHMFILPWRGCSLIGTSYVAAEDIDDPVIDRVELDQLLTEINRHLPTLSLTKQEVVHAFSGIYPLQENTLNEKTYQGTGDYQIVDHSSFGYEGIISALGAKFTTARLVAEKVTDRAIAKLGITGKPCQTRLLRLSSANYSDINLYIKDKTRAFDEHMNADQVERLVKQYGSNIDHLVQMISNDPGMVDVLCENRPNLAAEITYAVKSEMALKLDDVIYRRTGIGTVGFPSQNCIERCTSIMADLLGWSTQRSVAEADGLNRYKRFTEIA
ncbi:MAG: glycerol-3-phosphate dehydrogenase/oxidase [Arenicellales bacterium]|nr:glycerol-3-phosphate dehydrogenase/oxidase [Arenicellales bacterium]